MTFVEILPILINILLIVLLTIFIIIGIKLIIIMNKADKLVSDVQNKVSSLDSLFNLVSIANDKIGYIINKSIEIIMNLVNKMFNRRKDDNNE